MNIFLFYHTIIIPAIPKRFLAFVERLSVVELPCETQYDHVAVVGGPVGMGVGMHRREVAGRIESHMEVQLRKGVQQSPKNALEWRV